ncbi:MAG: hypothetical protein JWP89_961 [Schlesneria sp.]|nr:hypothetical protein [Schlesneria sp.]
MAVSSRTVTGQQFEASLSGLHPLFKSVKSVSSADKNLIRRFRRSTQIWRRPWPEIPSRRHVRPESSANWWAAGKINGKLCLPDLGYNPYTRKIRPTCRFFPNA